MRHTTKFWFNLTLSVYPMELTFCERLNIDNLNFHLFVSYSQIMFFFKLCAFQVVCLKKCINAKIFIDMNSNIVAGERFCPY